jgi:anti-sigma B factor antagonist
MFEVTQQGGWTVVKLSGDVDLAVGPAIHQALLDLVGRPQPAIAVDLSEVEFVDTTGVRREASCLRQGIRSGRGHGSSSGSR